MTDQTSQLSPPTLHWSQAGSNGDKCDLCRATIKPLGECFVSVRRAFELQSGRMVETEPIRVLMCVACGWTRPYAPIPMPSEPPKAPQEPNAAPHDAFPQYHDAGVMDA